MWKVINLFILLLLSTMVFGGENDIRVTKTIILMGDSQEHERHGTFTVAGGKLVDNITKAAARSPQQDLYVKYSMANVIEKHIISKDLGDKNAAEFAIHLGDFLDISCQSEWDRFLKVSKNYITNGKMILGMGNHDGFYVGNFAFNSMLPHRIASGQSWQGRCDAGVGANDCDLSKNIMHKGKLVKEIVKLLSESSIPPTTPSKMTSDTCDEKMSCGVLKVSDSWTIYFQYPVELDSNKISGDLSKQGKYWQSYLVSEVKLPGAIDSADVRMIIMDSSQAKDVVDDVFKINSSNNEILHGTIQPKQMVLIDKLLKTTCGNTNTDCLRLLAGHHPITANLKGSTGYTDKSRKWVKGEILNTNSKTQNNHARVLNLYISAHTHGGYFKKIQGVNELNVGALIENNPHYRTFWITKDISGHYFAHSESKRLSAENNGKCPIGWKYLKDFPDATVTNKTVMGDPHTLNYSSDLVGYLDKYAYLEQSRAEFINAFKRLEKAKADGNTKAIALWSDPKLKIIYENLVNWSLNVKYKEFAAIKKQCQLPIDKTSPQVAYWSEKNYQSIDSVIKLLEMMEGNLADLRVNQNQNKQCFGGNASKGHFYLAHTEARFLGLLQDWFEDNVDNEAFRINGEENQADYRIDSARCAASSVKYVSDKSTDIDSMDITQ